MMLVLAIFVGIVLLGFAISYRLRRKARIVLFAIFVALAVKGELNFNIHSVDAVLLFLFGPLAFGVLLAEIAAFVRNIHVLRGAMS